MEHKRTLELALEALQNQKAQLEAEVEALRAEMRGSAGATLKRKAAPTAGFKGKRRAKTPTERKAQSKRMKVGWAAGGSESENDGSLEPQEQIEER